MKKQIVFLLITLLFLSAFGQPAKFFSIVNSKNAPPVELLPSEVIIDDADPRIIYTGDWHTDADTKCIKSTQHYSVTGGAMSILFFSGTYLNIYYYLEQGGGLMNVWIDNERPFSIDCRSAGDTTLYGRVFYVSGLKPGSHIVKLVHGGMPYDNRAPHPAHNHYPVVIDAFGVSKTDNP